MTPILPPTLGNSKTPERNPSEEDSLSAYTRDLNPTVPNQYTYDMDMSTTYDMDMSTFKGKIMISAFNTFRLLQIDRETLVVANVIAGELQRGPFSSAEEARKWLNDSKNKKQLEKILELDLKGLGLLFFPPELKHLKNLQCLNLENNNLTLIPGELGNLTQMHELSLQNNRITALPKEIGKLKSLYWLFLQNNQLTSLPSEIRNLTLLEKLCLQNNQITALPIELRNLFWSATAFSTK